MAASKIILGTRGSELARAQSRLVENVIRSRHSDVAIEIKIIATKGDDAKIVDPCAGRKGLFTANIERALLTEEIDVAVHSAKDLPSEPSLGAKIAAVLPRAPIDDVLVSKHRRGLACLPGAAIVATGSVRRKRQLHWQRADLNVIDLRGTCRHGCASSRRTTGTRSFWLAPDWSVWAFYGRTQKSTLKVGNFFLKSFPTEFFYPQVVRA